MKTSNLLTLALIGVGVFYIVKAYKKKNQPLAISSKGEKSEPKANSTGFEVPTSGNKIFTQYGLI